jgi:hypothetical protein
VIAQHGVVANGGLGVAFLRFFEIIKRKEERQKARIGRRFETEQMGRVDDEDAVQGEAWRPRVDVANAGEEERGHELAVGRAATKLLDGHFRAFFARCAFDQRDEGLELGAEAEQVRRDLGVGAVEQERRRERRKELTAG